MAALILYLILKRRRRIEEQRNGWRYRLKDVQNPFELSEEAYISRFILSKEATLSLIEDLRPHMKAWHNGYSLELQVLSALSIMGSGSFQQVVADGVLPQISKSSASRFLHKFVEALLIIVKKYIRFPTTSSEIQETSAEFYTNFGFPNVIGAIDCIHVHINKPTVESYAYKNRESRYSINVQMVCDSNLRIIDVVARWPGSTVDSFIWNLSGARHMFSSDRIQHPVFLLGDNDYPLERWLLTPYRNPSSTLEHTFNKKHRSTRNVIEKCFDTLKSRFKILGDSEDVMLYDPVKCCRIIIAAAVLHNVCLLHNVRQPETGPLPDNYDSDGDYQDDVSDTSRKAAAEILRSEIAARFQARK